MYIRTNLSKKLMTLVLTMTMILSGCTNLGIASGYALEEEAKISAEGNTDVVIENQTPIENVSESEAMKLEEDNNDAVNLLDDTSGEENALVPVSDTALDVIYWNPQDTEYFVDGQVYIQGGDDANDGSSSDVPVRTFERAMDLVADGGEIRIMKVCMVESDTLIDGGDKNIKLTRWEGSDVADSYTGIYFVAHNGVALTIKNITFGATRDEKEDRQIQLAGKSTVLNIGENVEVNGYLFLETPGAKIMLNEDPPQEKYKLQFEDNADFDKQTVVENADGTDISGRISDYFELKVNIYGDNIYKYYWLLIQNGNTARIDVEKRDLYPGIYLNGTDVGDDANDGISPERPVKTFAKAKELAKTLYNGECTIYICGQVTVNKTETWELPKSEYPNCMVQRFDNASGTYEGGEYNGTLVEIAKGGKLILHDLTIDGAKDNVIADSPAVTVYGTLHMNSGSVITNCRTQKNIVGTGIQVKETGTMIMSDNSEVSNCENDLYTYAKGGGIGNYGKLTITGQAKVFDCYAFGAGSEVCNYGMFYLNGNAEITNALDKSHKSSAIDNNLTMEMSENASIHNCAEDGISNNGILTMSGGSIYNTINGITVTDKNAELTVIAGEIYENEKDGILVSIGTCRMEGGTSRDNTLGIDVKTGDLYLDINAKIQDTIALNNVNYPIKLTDKQSRADADKWPTPTYSIQVSKGDTNEKAGFYSGSVIVVPSGEKGGLTDVSNFAGHFVPVSDYRTSGYKKDIIISSGIYIDGVNGNDTNSGTGPQEAVKTFERAKELLIANQGTADYSDIIYVVDTVTVADESAWGITDDTLDTIQLERFQFFDGVMIDVTGTLTLTDGITIRGMSRESSEDKTTLEVIAKAPMLSVTGILTLSGAKLTSAKSQENGSAIQVKTGGKFYTDENTEISHCVLEESNYGGAVYAETDTEIVLSGNTVLQNCTGPSSSSALGGAVYSEGVMKIEGNTAIKDCIAANGSAVAIGANGTLTIGTEDKSSTVTIFGGTCIGSTGGAVYVLGTGTMYDGSTITNVKSLYGANGIVVAGDGDFTMYGGSISNNVIDGLYTVSGGGVYLKDNAVFTMYGGEIRNNVANGSGGGVYITKSAVMNLNGGVIAENKLIDGGTLGGGIYCAGTLNMASGSIENNTAKESGGGIYVAQTGNVNVTGGSIVNNSASGQEQYMGGGAIYNSGNLVLNGGSMSNNDAILGNSVYVAKVAILTKTNGKVVLTDGQQIYLQDPQCPITLSGAPNDGNVYVIDMPNVFLNKVVVKPDGESLISASSEIEHFKLSDRASEEWNYVLMEAGDNIIVGDPNSVYLDGVNGSDSNNGAAPETAVRTWSRVLEILNNGKDGAMIYIVGTVTIDNPLNLEKWTLADYQSTTVKRYAGFTDGELIHIPVGESFSLEDIILDGGFSSSVGAESTTGLISVSGSLDMKNGTTVQNNCILNTEHGAAVTVNAGGTLTMESGSAIENNLKRMDAKTNLSARGSGLYIYFGGSVELVDGSLVKNNRIVTRNTTLSYASGAGVYCMGTLVTSGEIYGNTSDGAGAYGGGVYVGAAGYAQMKGGSISGNAAYTQTQMAVSTSHGGGGIYVASGAAFDMEGGTVSSNRAGRSPEYNTATTTDYLSGGGIWNGGKLHISGGSITENGFYLPDGYNAHVCSGGNIYSANELTIDETIASVFVTNNRNDTQGNSYRSYGSVYAKGTVNVNGGSFTGTSSETVAIYLDAAEANFSRAYIAENEGGAANFTGNSTVNFTGEKLEDIELTGNGGKTLAVNSSKTTLTLNNVWIHDNHGSEGLHIHEYGNIVLNEALIEKNEYTDAVTTSWFGGNFTINDGVVITGNKVGRAAVSNGWYSYAAGFTMNGGEITNNTSLDGVTHIMTPGLYLYGGTINGGKICGNKPQDGCTASVGGIYVFGGTLKITGGEICHNNAYSSYAAGGIYCAGSGLLMTGGTVHDNGARYSGNTSKSRIAGGIYLLNGTLSLSNTSIYENVADCDLSIGTSTDINYNLLSAGGLYISKDAKEDTTVLGENVKIHNNSSTAESNRATLSAAGGIVVEGKLTVNGAEITNNTSEIRNRVQLAEQKFQDTVYIPSTDTQQSVGGIHIASGGTVYFMSGSLSDNTSQDVDVTDVNAGFLKNGIYLGGTDALYLDGKNANITDNIYLSMVGRTVKLYGTPSSANRYKLSVASDFQAGDVVVEPDGDQITTAGIYSQNFSNANQKFAVTDGDGYKNIILASIIFLASYGDDHNDGTTPVTPVATFKRAVSLMKHPTHDRIYICGTVYIGEPEEPLDDEGRILTVGDGTQNWALPSTTSVYRYDGFDMLGRSYDAFAGDLITVCDGGELNLGVGDSNIETGVAGVTTESFTTLVVDGAKMSGTTGSIVAVEEGGILNVNSGVSLTRNQTDADGAAIRNYGTTNIDSANFTENGTSGRGAFVYQNGVLNIKGETVTDGDVYLGSNPTDKGYYINVTDTFTPNAKTTGTLTVNLPLSDSYTYRKIAVYSDNLEEPNDVEKAKYVLPDEVLALYQFQNNAADAHILELYRDAGLRIDKIAGVGGVPQDASFEFTVEFTADEGIVLPTTLDYTIFDAETGNEQSTGTLNVTDGKVTFCMGVDKYVELKGIPAGVTYKVNETNDDGYFTSYDAARTGKIVSMKSDDSGALIPGSGNENPRTVVTNTPKGFGTLEVVKTVAGNDADTEKYFDFTVTITRKDDLGTTVTDTDFNGTYGNMTFIDGVATFTMKHGDTVTANSLPNGTAFKVTEADYSSEGYRSRRKSYIGVIVKDETKTAMFSNVRETYGDLVINKTIAGNDINSYKDFKFILTLDDASINGAYGGVTFKNGVAEFTLKGGQSKTVEDLPNGVSYTVMEDDYYTEEGYIPTTDGLEGSRTSAGTIVGNITKDATFSSEFVNTRNTYGNLAVTKAVSGNATEVDKDFNFTVTLDDKTVNETYGDMTFTSGVAKFTLKAGETKTAQGLPNGMSYEVTEDSYSTEGYTTQYTGNRKGKIVGNSTIELTVTNTRYDYGTLTIMKKLSGNDTDSDKLFNFTVTLSDKTISGQRGDAYFTRGVATLFIRGGGTKVIKNLPGGTEYIVQEADYSDDGYELTEVENAEGTISMDNPAAAVFTNTRNTYGGIKVNKSLEGDFVETERYFKFTVTLDDTTINGRYGEMYFTNGKAVFALKGGQEREAAELPNGIGYTVEESDYADAGYITKYTSQNESGTIIGNSTIEVNVLNIRNKASSLTVSKTVDGNDRDSNKSFEFTVVFNDTTINGTYGDVEISDGVGTFSLKNGETSVLENIPTGTEYTVTEADYSADGYETSTNGGLGWSVGNTVSGAIRGDNSSTAQFKNTRNTYGALKISKTVDGNSGDVTKEFRFTIYVQENNGLGRMNGQFGDVTISSGYGSFTLKAGESVTLTGLPNGTAYSVSEDDYTSDGYITKSTGASGTIKGYPEGSIFEPQEAAFTNTRDTAALSVCKKLSGNAVDKTKRFDFTVTLTRVDDSGNTVTDESLTGQYGDVYFTKGVATIQLKGGEKVLIKDVQDGTGYMVTEADYSGDGYTTTVNGALSNTTAGIFDVTAPATAEFTNTRSAVGNLSVTKRISGDAAVSISSFDATVTLSDKNISGTYGDMTFINGVAAIKLEADQTLIATGLPNGVKYTVTEADYSRAGYSTSYVGDKGTISEGTTQVCEITNVKNAVGSLTVLKTLSGNDTERTRDFRFTVTLSDQTINGTFGNAEFTNGVASFNLRGGQTKIISNLPSGIDYTVDEEDCSGDGYITTTNGNNKGTITEDEAIVAQFINTRSTLGSLTVTKEVAGSNAEKDREFLFHVVLNDTTINGTYGSMNFANGEAVFTLKDGESIKADELPNGTGFTIYEEGVSTDGYIISASGDINSFSGGNAKGEITGNQDKSVTFTNTRNIFGSLTVSKYLDGNDVETNREFTLTVTLIKQNSSGDKTTDTSVNGIYGDANFKNGVSEIKLKGGESAVITELPAGTEYMVAEKGSTIDAVSGKTKFEDYTVEYTGCEGVIEVNKVRTASVTNIRNTSGDFNITKRLTGNIADGNTEFRFVVSVTTDSGNATFKIGDKSYTGIASFALKHNKTVTLTEVPNDALITVTEADYSGNGYTTTYKVDDGTAESGRTVTVKENTKVAQTVTFINHRAVDIDMGILLDCLPYAVLASVTFAGIVIFIFRRRRKGDAD